VTSDLLPEETVGGEEGEWPVLSVTDLSITAGTGAQSVTLVRDVSLTVAHGETLGIVGESGSGKTVTALSVGGLLPAGLRVASGSVRFEGRELVAADPETLRSIRGSKIGFVFQDPQNSLDPVFTIGDQLIEAIRAHRNIPRRDARVLGIELLGRVGIAKADKRFSDYPHQFSGGMAQRVVMAIALCCDPQLLIADEPTTSLDVTMQAQILELLNSLKGELGLSVLLISHDLGVVAEMADRVAVMYAGQMVEEGLTTEMFTRPRHPYLDALIGAQPDGGDGGQRLTTIPGRVPSAARMPTGCRFHPRCSFAEERCRTGEVALVAFPSSSAHSVRCIRADELELQGIRRGGASDAAVPLRSAPGKDPRPESEVLLEVRGLTKQFVARRGVFGRGRFVVNAVDQVSFDIHSGETLGLVGETGAGKSTVGRLVLGLESPSSGSLNFRGVPLRGVDKRPMSVHRDIQAIFQNPYASLNPSMTVAELVAEPIDVHGRLPRDERLEAVRGLLGQVGLDSEYLGRHIYELSGGQLQRIAIARALSVNPKLIVLDEPISSLDVSTQAQVINLLEDLQLSHGLSYLFIGHNLAVVSHISHRLAILFGGRVVEVGESHTVYRRPRHPYTQALIGAILSTDPTNRRAVSRTGKVTARPSTGGAPGAPGDPGAGDRNSEDWPVHGCVYAGRCPLAQAVCWEEPPPAVSYEDGTTVHCHFAEESAGSFPGAADDMTPGGETQRGAALR
jgi:peptide/nickel transport system ATP-binding protein